MHVYPSSHLNPPGTSEGPEIMLMRGVRDKRFQKGKQSSQGNTVSKRLGSGWGQVARSDRLCHIPSRHSPVAATCSYGEGRIWKPYLLGSKFDSCSSLRSWCGTMSCHLISSSRGFLLWKGELQIIHWAEGVWPVVTAQIQQHKWALESKTSPLFTASHTAMVRISKGPVLRGFGSLPAMANYHRQDRWPPDRQGTDPKSLCFLLPSPSGYVLLWTSISWKRWHK